MLTYGITMGDPAGIGAEVVVKALRGDRPYRDARPVVIGDGEAILDALRFCGLTMELHRMDHPAQAMGIPGVIDLIDLKRLSGGAWEYGKVQANCGALAYAYVERAVQLASAGRLQAVVTAPLNKEALHLAGYQDSGHTEILARLTGAKEYAMLLISPSLNVIHVTTHCSLREACDRATEQRIVTVIHLADQSMRLLGVPSPHVAVAGLNPHCSENGLFGWEEERCICPAIQRARKEGLHVTGPVPPDTVFVKAMAGQFDIVVAMYHDQGHIPAKLSGFRMDRENGRMTSMGGVNVTVGLPIIRTSVDHGTAFEIAGQGIANEESMLDAVDMAVRMAYGRDRPNSAAGDKGGQK